MSGLFRERWLCLKSEQKLKLGGELLVQAPEDIEAALDKLLRRNIRRCDHTYLLVELFRWTSTLGLLVVLALILGGLVDVVYFVRPTERGPIESVLIHGLKGASLVTITTWLIGWRLDLQLVAAERELREIFRVELAKLLESAFDDGT
jgi:hypothetical protein